MSPSVVDPDGAAARDIAAIANELMKLGEHESMIKGTKAHMAKAKEVAGMTSKQLSSLLRKAPPRDRP